MRIAQIVDKTEVEGPSIRTAIWVQGCTINCPGCCNQNYLPSEGGIKWDEEELAKYCSQIEVEGITLLGGEPLQQPQSVYTFLQYLQKMCDRGVMLFTGYTWQYVQKKYPEIIDYCDLIIAGPFMQNLSPSNKRWIGSKNQTVHFISKRYQNLQEKWEPHRNEVEFHIKDGEIIINGTPFDTGIL